MNPTDADTDRCNPDPSSENTPPISANERFRIASTAGQMELNVILSHSQQFNKHPNRLNRIVKADQPTDRQRVHC